MSSINWREYPEWYKDITDGFIQEEINRNIFNEFVNEFNIDGLYSGKALWPKMIKRKFQKISELSEEETIPYTRKCEMYELFNKRLVLVVHFYEDVDESIITSEVEDFISDRGLSVEWLSYDESWYNPGVSLTGVFEVEDEDVYVRYIDTHRVYDGKLNKHFI